MPSNNRTNGSSNGPQVPEPTTVVTPTVKDGVGEIAAKLVGIDTIIEGLDLTSIGRAPDLGEVLQDISKLRDEIKDIKLAQDTQINALRNGVKNNTKKEITETLEGQISAIIASSVADHVKEEVENWGNKSGTKKFVNALKDVMEKNDPILEGARVQLENSRSRHANSAIDIEQDFNTALEQIKHNDGYVSEFFPMSLRELFSYDATQLLQLLNDYDLQPLEKHSENLNRFLLFIGSRSLIQE